MPWIMVRCNMYIMGQNVGVRVIEESADRQTYSQRAGPLTYGHDQIYHAATCSHVLGVASGWAKDQNTQTLNGALAFVPFILQQALEGIASQKGPKG